MYVYRLTPSAVQDLQEIADYIANQLRAPDGAIQLLDEIHEAIQAACAHPLSLPAINDALLHKMGYHKITIKKYVVFVIPDSQNNVLQVMRAMYCARDALKEL